MDILNFGIPPHFIPAVIPNQNNFWARFFMVVSNTWNDLIWKWCSWKKGLWAYHALFICLCAPSCMSSGAISGEASGGGRGITRESTWGSMTSITVNQIRRLHAGYLLVNQKSQVPQGRHHQKCRGRTCMRGVEASASKCSSLCCWVDCLNKNPPSSLLKLQIYQDYCFHDSEIIWSINIELFWMTPDRYRIW